MRSAGLRSLTYRLRTELAGEAWHWNPSGTWSEPDKHQGYWMGNPKPGAPIDVTWGYRLPRRGNTFDQANNDGYSRIDDGDTSTYWKSNPYLGDTPQWIVIDLRRHVAVDGMRIRWANPYALRYRVEYWQGAENYEEDDSPDGQWHAFSKGSVSKAKGGNELVKLGEARQVRFIRVILQQSSHSSEDRTSKDPRDRTGFAVREIEIGKLEKSVLRDAVTHRPTNLQTPIYTSSTDPWHREIDLDRNTEQPGFDLIFKSPLSTGRPMLVSTPALYDTPDNAAAEIRWLRARGYPIRGVEVGEEPDGQCADPEHYASLYLQIARRIQSIDPKLLVGGPSFQTATSGFSAWPDQRPKSWMRRFTDELKAQRAVPMFGFLTFEWYPFDRPFGDASKNLRENTPLLKRSLAQFRRDGLPPNLPWMITEYGYSAFAGPHDVDLESAIVNLDTVGQSLTLGATAAYLYGCEPGPLISEYKGQWGNLMTWLVNGNGDARDPMPAFWAAQIMTNDWCLPGSLPHRLVKASCPDSLLTVYAVKRPDGVVTALILTKDPVHSKTIDLMIGGERVTKGTTIQFGPAQYSWKPSGPASRPEKDLPPARTALRGPITLPPHSITVVRTIY